MAERRMFAKTIIDSDAFLDMPLSTQALYFHLSMRADDDGLINSPKKIMRMIGAAEDELRVLISRKFIIPFESGIVVIKHWKIHNYIRRDMYNPTKYKEEFESLTLDENNSYTLGVTEPLRTCNEPVAIPSTQDRLGKDSLGKNKKNIVGKPDYAAIIARLNEKAGTNYKPGSSKTQTCINARFNEGFTLEDFETVIDKKCDEWIGTDMEKYLRPETLFGPKFESYLNARAIKPKAKQNSFTSHQRSDTTDYDALAKKIFVN